MLNKKEVKMHKEEEELCSSIEILQGNRIKLLAEVRNVCFEGLMQKSYFSITNWLQIRSILHKK